MPEKPIVLSNYGATSQKAQSVELTNRSKESRKIKGVLDEVDLNTLLLACVVCFFVTFGVKATQSTKENAIKNFVVLLGGITLFALLLATGFLDLPRVCPACSNQHLYAVMKIILLHQQQTEEQQESESNVKEANTPNTLC